MSVTVGEVADVASRVRMFVAAWGELDLDGMQNACQRKPKGRLGADISGAVVTFFTDEVVGALSALWSAERAHFLLRYDSFAGKGKWFQRPMLGPNSKRIDSVYAQVIDRVEKVLDIVGAMRAQLGTLQPQFPQPHLLSSAGATGRGAGGDDYGGAGGGGGGSGAAIGHAAARGGYGHGGSGRGWGQRHYGDARPETTAVAGGGGGGGAAARRLGPCLATLGNLWDMLDHARRIAKVRTVMVPIYRSLLVNARPMNDGDVMGILGALKTNNFHVVPSMHVHRAWYNCSFEIEALRLSCVAHQEICAYNFQGSVLALRRCEQFMHRWEALVARTSSPPSQRGAAQKGPLFRQVPLFKWFQLQRERRLSIMSVYFHNLWRRYVQTPADQRSNGRDGQRRVVGRQPSRPNVSHGARGDFCVNDDAAGRFRHLTGYMQRSELVGIITGFVRRCYNEYTDPYGGDSWTTDDPAQGLGSDMDVSVNVLLDATSLHRSRQQQTSAADPIEAPGPTWRRDINSAYVCPLTRWCDQYESKQHRANAVAMRSRAGTHDVPLAGLDSFPSMFHTSFRAGHAKHQQSPGKGKGGGGAAEEARLHHWPTIISYITAARQHGLRADWTFDKFFHHYEEKFHTTFFMFSPDPHVYLCVVCQNQKRFRKDLLVAEFFEVLGQRLTNNMDITRQAKNLSAAKPVRRK